MEMKKREKIKETFWRKNVEGLVRGFLQDIKERKVPTMLPRLLAAMKDSVLREKRWAN